MTLKTISYDCSFSSSSFASPFDILKKSKDTFIREFTGTSRSRNPRSDGRFSDFRVRPWDKHEHRLRNPHNVGRFPVLRVRPRYKNEYQSRNPSNIGRFPVLRISPWDKYEYQSRNPRNIGRFQVFRVGLLDKYENRDAHQKSLELDKKGIIEKYVVASSFDKRYVRRESRTDHILKYNCQPRKLILSRHSKMQLKRDP